MTLFVVTELYLVLDAKSRKTNISFDKFCGKQYQANVVSKSELVFRCTKDEGIWFLIVKTAKEYFDKKLGKIVVKHLAI